MDATLTNAITNALHAVFLLLYFLGAQRHRRLGNSGFTRLVVGLFGLLFVVKLLGVYVHYRPPGGYDVSAVWGLIAIMVVALNGLTLNIVGAPKQVQIGAVLLSAATALGFVLSRDNFALIALPSALVFTAAAIYSRGRLRLGFVLVVVSNIIWIIARAIGSALAGGELPFGLRYDNDLYHFLLIGSTFVIYKGFAARHRSL